MKKPTVKRVRHTRKVFIDYYLDIEVSAISLVEKLQNYIDAAEKDPLRCSDVKVSKYGYDGYDCEAAVQVYYEAYSETEEEHKERVVKEVEFLEDWQKWKVGCDEATGAFNKELRERHIKEMEEELTKLKEEL